jgi:alkylation response protein AidB-like acyl-CoA dehydrogenase
VKYAKQRIQFGKPICEFGLIKRKISEMAIRIFTAESMMYRSAGLIEGRLQGLDMNSDQVGIRTAEAMEEYLIECSINKIFGSETEDYVVDEEVQIFGGYGYIHGNHPELAYRNARINRIWEGTNEINRIVIANTLIRRAAKGEYDLKAGYERVAGSLQDDRPVETDDPEGLKAQRGLLRLIKDVFLFVFGRAYEKHGNALRHEQQIIGMLSDMIIEIWAAESALLRAEKILKGKNAERGEIPVKMAKVLFHDSVERMGFLAKSAMESMEEEPLLKKPLTAIRVLIDHPPIPVAAWRQQIADSMVRGGRYVI